jgi:hypothetical protein
MIIPCTKEVAGSVVKKKLLEASHCIKKCRDRREIEMSCARRTEKMKQIWGKREMGVRVKKGKMNYQTVSKK